MTQILITFGFSWMVVGALVGLLLAKRHDTTAGQLEKIAAEGNLAEYHRVDDIYKANKNVHVHTFLFSVVAVCIGLSMAKMNYSESTTNVLAGALMFASVVWTIGAVLLNRAFMVVGDLSLLICIVTAAIGMAKAL